MAYDKVVDSAALDSALTATADAIRAKTGSEDAIAWDAEKGFAGAVEGIPEGVSEQEIIERTAKQELLTGDVVLQGDTLAPHAFTKRPITSFRGDNVVSISQGSLRDCPNMVSCDLPRLKALTGDEAIAQNSMLTALNIPEVETISQYGSFRGNSAIEWITLPKFKNFVGTVYYTWGETAKLKVLDIGPLFSVFYCGLAFVGGSGCKVLVFRYDGVVSLTSQTNLQFCPIYTGTGFLLVPSARIEEYKVATNWVTIFETGTQFLPVEDYTVDGTTTGELDKAKIEELIAA